MSIAEPLTVLKNEWMQKNVAEVVELLTSALHEAMPAHKVEDNLWHLLLKAASLPWVSLPTRRKRSGTSSVTSPTCPQWLNLKS